MKKLRLLKFTTNYSMFISIYNFEAKEEFYLTSEPVMRRWGKKVYLLFDSNGLYVDSVSIEAVDYIAKNFLKRVTKNEGNDSKDHQDNLFKEFETRHSCVV